MKTSKQKVGSKALLVIGVTRAEDGSLIVVMKQAVPSLNALLAMHWRSRHKLKEQVQESLSSALQASDATFWTKITWWKSTTLTPFGMLRSYLATRLVKRQSRLRKSKSRPKKKSTPAS